MIIRALTGPVAAVDAHARTQRLLLRRILKQVSRSFYLSLIVLPQTVRPQISLAYLFCRAADTIADTHIVPYDERLDALNVFRQQFHLNSPSWEELIRLRDWLRSHQGTEGERQLLHHLPACFRLYSSLTPADQQLIRELVSILTQGMEMDLTSFPAEPTQPIRALSDLPALDRYTYYVAGVVGEFWTKIHVAHIPALQGYDLPALCNLGIRFGKGLQMTNVLKDLGRDLHIGRCYLPQALLDELHVDLQALRHPEARDRILPLIHRLVHQTLDHLDHARDYIGLLPARAIRLRLSCMWPLLFAVQTLDVICRSETLLHPQARVKISRRAVYRTMACSLCCLLMPRLFVWYYDRLRQRLLAALHA